MSKADVEAIKKAKDGLDVWDDVLRYAQTGFDTIAPDDFPRMRWYGIYQQQPNEGHFMLRVKIPSGDMSSAQMRAVAEVARDYGQQHCRHHHAPEFSIPLADDRHPAACH